MAISSAAPSTSTALDDLESQIPSLLDEGYQSGDTQREFGNKAVTVTSVDPNFALAEKLRGKLINLPAHMITIFDDLGWPVLEFRSSKWDEKRREKYRRLRNDLEEFLDVALAANPRRLKKAKQSDYALFNLLWYPDSLEYRILWPASLITTFLFIWDDCVDSNDGVAAKDFERASAWRAETLAVIEKAFLDDHLADTSTKEESGPLMAIAEFARLVRELGLLNRDQLKRIFYEMKNYVEATEEEQGKRIAGELPASLDEYLACREYSSAAYPCCLAHELGGKMPLPIWIMESDEMKTILKAGNLVTSLHNDIFSLKKEVADNCLINSLPVLHFSGTGTGTGLPWEDIIPHLDVVLRDFCRGLDEAAEKLLCRIKADIVGCDDLGALLVETTARFIDGVRMMCTGNLGYSLVTERYRNVLENRVMPDGSIEIVV